jgi:hypothetical protein
MSRRPVTSGTVPGIVTCIGCAHDRGRRELRDRDVVRVAVGAIRTKCDDYVGPNASDTSDNCSDGSRSIDLVDGSIGVAQYEHFTNTKHCGGGSKFRFTHSANLSGFGLSIR